MENFPIFAENIVLEDVFCVYLRERVYQSEVMGLKWGGLGAYLFR